MDDLSVTFVLFEEKILSKIHITKSNQGVLSKAKSRYLWCTCFAPVSHLIIYSATVSWPKGVLIPMSFLSNLDFYDLNGIHES